MGVWFFLVLLTTVFCDYTEDTIQNTLSNLQQLLIQNSKQNRVCKCLNNRPVLARIPTLKNSVVLHDILFTHDFLFAGLIFLLCSPCNLRNCLCQCLCAWKLLLTGYAAVCLPALTKHLGQCDFFQHYLNCRQEGSGRTPVPQSTHLFSGQHIRDGAGSI